ncbi:hypothetical protein O0L34_g1866 [Tuta absoluta]|nr:hypothetical protein O0L34_g1866 [Tuta absoluta]
MLDLALSNIGAENIEVREAVTGALVKADRYHPPLDVVVRLPRGSHIPPPPPPPASCSAAGNFYCASEWNFRKADYLALYEDIMGIDWSAVLRQQDVNSAVHLFYSLLYAVIDRHVPKKRTSRGARRHYPPWYTDEIKRKLVIKYFHLKKYKCLGLEFNSEVYKYYRSHIKDLVDAAYQQYVSDIARDICLDPTKFWSYAKSRQGSRSQNHDLLYNNKTVNGQEAATAFAEYFGSVFHPGVPRLDPVEAEYRAGGESDATYVHIERVSVADIRRATRRLKTASATGPDGIPAFLVKDCSAVLELPLLYIFNLSLQHGDYPIKWKLSRVVPVPKSGSSKDITMFRPIAILSVFGKVFESILNFYILAQIKGQLDDSQHGFRSAQSTTTNHIAFVDYVASQMDLRKQVDATYFDFKKAFDLVDNDVILSKMSQMGFVPVLLQFFASYLKDRMQFVRFENYHSNTFYTRSGVSQGSTLGPSLFLIMINDLPKVLKAAKCLMFADDLKLFLSVGNTEDCQNLQSDIDAVTDWCVINNLHFNVAKCRVLSYTRSIAPIIFPYAIDSVPLERVESIRDLGIVMDSRLDFHDHITTICKDASKTLGFIMRTSSQFPDTRVATLLYTSFVRSKLEYCAMVWDPHEANYGILIERVQRKFNRYLYKRMYGYYPWLFPSLFVNGMVGLDTLELRRKMHLFLHYVSLLRGRVNNPEVLSAIRWFVPDSYVRTGRRRHELLAGPASRTRSSKNAPTQRATALINDLIAKIQDADICFDSIRSLSNSFRLYYNNINN